MVSDYEVMFNGGDKTNSNNEFFVKLKGPVNSPYEGVKEHLFSLIC